MNVGGRSSRRDVCFTVDNKYEANKRLLALTVVNEGWSGIYFSGKNIQFGQVSRV